MRKNDEIGYGSFVEKELRRVVAIKLSVNQGRFRDGSMFFGGRRDTPTPTHSTFYPGSWDIFGIWHNITVDRMGDRRKLKDKTMNAKYKVAITEIAAKTAAKKNGGAEARFFGVIVIEKESGEKRTAAYILTAAAKKAAVANDEKAAATIRERAKIYGGAYRRDTAAIVAAAAYAEMNGGELAKSIAARLDEARRTEAEYTAEEERRKAERKARRLAAMSDAEKAAAARRDEIRAIKADAKKRIDAIKAAA